MRLAALLLCLLALSSPARSLEHRPVPAARLDAPVFAPGEILVGLDANKARTTDVAAAFDLEELPAPGLARLGAARFRVRGVEDAASVAARVATLPGVRYAEPNAIVYPAGVPSDPLYGGVSNVPTDLQRWAYGGIGDNTVLNAEPAWDITTGDPSVVIAVIDSGLDLDNPEFQNLWTNVDETPGNGVDDDRNGYIDDVHGFDFYAHGGDVNPSLGDGIDNDGNGRVDDSAAHGTISAALISASHDGMGMAGGAPGCSLMIVKVFGDDGGVRVDDLAEAIQYAADNGADVINLSLSTLFSSKTLSDAVRYAVDLKAVIVAAAGNGNSAAPQYPASFKGPISVGGSGSGFSQGAIEGLKDLGRVNGRWPSSQYGLGAVNVVAPAVVLSASVATFAYNAEHPEVPIGSTYYGIFEGTSFSAPYVSALVGLILTHDKALHRRRTLSSADIKAMIERTATDLPLDISGGRNPGPAWDGSGRVNFLAALLAIPGAAEPNPVLERAVYKKKVLRVFGDGFSGESQIEVNGTVVALPVRFSYVDRTVEITGSKPELGLGKKGTNRIVVVERGVRTQEFVY